MTHFLLNVYVTSVNRLYMIIPDNIYEIDISNIFIIIIIIKEVGSARLGESYLHPISPKTPAPQYQPIDKKNENKEDKEGKSSLDKRKSTGPALEIRQSHTIEYSVSKIKVYRLIIKEVDASSTQRKRMLAHDDFTHSGATARKILKKIIDLATRI